jgi:thymidylate synthase ThyX
MSYKAEIVADSCNTFGNRLTTFLVTFPRFILAELNTHRVFTRNSASSRAIPYKKMVYSVITNPFIPIRWMKDHKGMQGSSFFEGGIKKWWLRNLWLTARLFAIAVSYLLNLSGLTKQLCNRLLEPFMWHTCLVSSTDYENFFALRAHKDAEIHIQKIAYMMLDLYNESVPRQLNEGEWHIPFGEYIIKELNLEHAVTYNIIVSERMFLQKISTAICARTSYTVVGDGKKMNKFIEDIKLHNRLSESGHWSTFEHCAKPMNNSEYLSYTRTQPLSESYKSKGYPGWTHSKHRGVIPGDPDLGVEYGWCGNFQGFIQYRKMFPNENRTDDRVIKAKSKFFL